MFVAFLTYNSIGIPQGMKNGIYKKGDCKALVLAGDKRWVTSGRKPHNDTKGDHGEGEVRDKIRQLWKQLARHTQKLDHIVLYLGREGSELALKKVAAAFPAEKVTIVSCKCNVGFKKMAIKSTGLEKARWLQCKQCGGQSSMHEIFIIFQETGKLPTELKHS